jgi:hypothetical protein
VSSGVFVWPSGCPLRLSGLPGDEVDDTQVDPCRGSFVGSFLGGDIFPRGGDVDRLAYPHIGLWTVATSQGDRAYL